MNSPNLITIGAYGWLESDFFGALETAGIDTFCDLRYRRGVRGAKYAFVNSLRLQARLDAIGIRYLHLKELAPDMRVRQVQHQKDLQTGIRKRSRVVLSPQFCESYASEVLANYDPNEFIEVVGTTARTVALFCVEGPPNACHRSLVAEFLGSRLGLPVVDIHPPFGSSL